LAIHLGSKSHRNKIASKERIQSLEAKKADADLIKTQSLYDLTRNPQSPQHNTAVTPPQLKIHTSSSNAISKLNNYCEICSTQLDSAIAYAVHLGSYEHKTKFKNYPPIKINTPVKAKRNTAPDESQIIQVASSRQDESHAKDFFCDVCLIIFNSEAVLTNHFLSEKHKKKVEVLELITKLSGNKTRDASSSDSRKSDSGVSDSGGDRGVVRAFRNENINRSLSLNENGHKRHLNDKNSVKRNDAFGSQDWHNSSNDNKGIYKRLDLKIMILEF